MNPVDSIPAFSMWKMFNDTIPALFEIEFSEECVKRLTNIFKSEEFSNIFVYNHDCTLSREEYEAIASKYESFTCWLLGKFFYLLNCEKLSRIHDIIIDAQLRILHLLSAARPHIYSKLSLQYSIALKVLVNYLKTKKETNILLKVFTPLQHEILKNKLDLSPTYVEITSRKACLVMLTKVIPFFDVILYDKFVFHRVDSDTADDLKNLLFVLAECDMMAKILTAGVFVKIVTNISTKNKYLTDFIEYFKKIIVFFYTKEMEISVKDVEYFEDILIQFLSNPLNRGNELEQIALILAKTIFMDYENLYRKPREKVQKLCFMSLPRLPEGFITTEDCLNLLFEQNNVLILHVIEKIVIEDAKLISRQIGPTFNICDVSKLWKAVLYQLQENLEQSYCRKTCTFKKYSNLLIEILNSIARMHIVLKDYLMRERMTICNSIIFVDIPNELFALFLKCLDRHYGFCNTTSTKDHSYRKVMVKFAFVASAVDLTTILHVLTYPLLPARFNTNVKCLNHFYKVILSISLDRGVIVSDLCDIINAIASDLFSVKYRQTSFEIDCFQLIKKAIREKFEDYLLAMITQKIPHLLSVLSNSAQLMKEIVMPLSDSKSEIVQKEFVKMSHQLICMFSWKYCKHISWDELNDTVIVSICCQKCCNGCEGPGFEQKVEPNKSALIKNVFKTYKNEEVTLIVLEGLRLRMDHVLQYLSMEQILYYVDHQSTAVRKAFAKMSRPVIHKILQRDDGIENLELFHIKMKDLVKTSLQLANFELQKTLVDILEEISIIDKDKLDLWVMQLLLYFIVLPNSKYYYLAIEAFVEMAEKRNTKTHSMYTKYRSELCGKIVDLAAGNYLLIGSDLGTSLENVAVILGFDRTRDFLLQEGQFLLPFLISMAVKIPETECFIKNMADLTRLSVKELITNKYGNIFVHIFLQETQDVCKKCLLYLEKLSGTTGQSLRKLNFRVIFNELLLDFCNNRERVVLALSLLAKEDTGQCELHVRDLPDYLQPKFLGILQHFDRKLVEKYSDQPKVLRSLVEIFKFMGPKHLGPLRFKIIATLQTALNSNCVFSELNCDVWDSFIRSCEVEAFGPQLAVIAVSLLPLLEHYPARCNMIFRYLIVENEKHLLEHIRDIFFMVDKPLDGDIQMVIKKHVKSFENICLKELLVSFLKYLNHEATDVRIFALKYIKNVLEKSRNELDQMILGYNGIDPILVEFLDILTLGCRDKSDAIKIMCGEVIGELGAVEPSHLPRRYVHAKGSFAFFMSDDIFVINILNELTKALQAEKNTQNIDRYAVAIQEILKVYEISSSETSRRHNVWKEFSESQRELMNPLLSSRYTVVQPEYSTYACPIYGSEKGVTFQSWLYNWTCSLVSSIPSDHKSLLQLCLPSMKQDRKILMEFLPHILCHSLLECNSEDCEKVFIEMMAIVNAANRNRFDERDLQESLLQNSSVAYVEQNSVPKDSKLNECTKVVFVLFDFLDRWIREWQWQKENNVQNQSNYKKIHTFLQRFSKLQLARCNHQCGEYPRALMYVEEYITDHPGEISGNLAFLSELYAKIDEPDGVTGVMSLQQSEPSLNQRILTLEVSGKLADAAACYERIQHPLKMQHLKGLIQCYLDLDNVNTALNLAQGAMERQPEFKNMLLEMQAEPLWRLGKYDDLNSLLLKPELSDNESWGVQIGKALLHFQNCERDKFKTVLEKLRHQQVKLLGAASLEEGAYQHGYNCIAKLHSLTELQRIENFTSNLLLHPQDRSCFDLLNSEWESRIKVVQESIRIREPMLCLRRVALEQSQRLIREKAPHAVPNLDTILGECWLLSAKTARTAGVHQQAFTYTLKAEKYSPPKLFLEKAKLHWLREEQESALMTLIRGLEKQFPGLTGGTAAQLTPKEREICAEARLLIASYNEQMSNVDTETTVQYYKESVEVFREWEKSYLYLGQYYDKVYGTYSDEDRDAKGSELQIHMINCFGKSLQYGSSFVYQSMPRLLSIWFDYGTRLLDVTVSATREERKNNLLRMTRLIHSFLDRLPAYIFLTAFSQLVSRICHPQKEVYFELKNIITKVLVHYPQQTLWMIITVIKSSYKLRSNRCAEIFENPQLKSPNMLKLVKDFKLLAEKLIELCNKEIPDTVNTVTVSTLLRTLPRMISKEDFSEIMVPTHKFRKLVLPNPDFSTREHNPFPNQYVHIVGIEDEMVILPSLQRPRKITFKGSDGKKYVQMLKPKDDLRKDFRLMEFNDIVNQLLSKEAESRQRRLIIRLYSVAPLNEECGLIEWVPNLVGLRPVLISLYKQKSIPYMKAKEIKENCCDMRDPLTKKRDIFTKKFLPRHPAVLGEWFRRTFPDAQSWLTARTAYIRTTAVMSMAGYILGLGDRHGENILLDATSGDVVHVDFNCLFNKGETFEWPEKVPFRLTNNMVGAMGPLGIEGVFRKSCVCTLRVLRSNTNTLMSIVTPFVYDPLVSWPRNMTALPTANNAERTNEQAVEHVKNIELRLQGLINTKSTKSFSTPLSVDGQVNNLIKEATSVDNLCQMYVGWGPYM